MLVKGIVPRGYCKGVVRAIEIAKKQAHQTAPVYILGMIVHNQYIVNALEDLGIQTIDFKGKTRLELLDEINEGKVIITAHGASQKVFDKAKEKGLEVIDASCLDVIKTHDLIQDKLNEGYEILYIGKKGHPEAEGAISIDEKRIHLITNIDDLKTIDPTKKYVMTNQTTMSLYDVYDLCEKAKEILPFVEIEKETCTATKIRQEAIKNIEDDVDIIFIVGDPHSNNTRKLASIAHDYHTCDVYMIESIEDLEIEWLKNKRYAAVSSGASTPTYLTNQVIDYLKQFDINDSKTYQKPIIDKNKILNIIVYSLLIFIVLFSLWTSQTKTDNSKLSYDKFIKMAKNKEISTVMINLNDTTFVATDNHKKNHTVDNPKYDNFKKDLLEYGIEVKESRTTNYMSYIFNFLQLAIMIFIMYKFYGVMLQQTKGSSSEMIIQKNGENENGKVLNNTTFADVAGLKQVKADLKLLVDFLKDPKKYNEAGAKMPKGVILYGPPGTGKTLLAKAIAGEANVPFLSMNGSDFVEMFVGVGAKRVRKLFEDAKKCAPCIVFVDEIDAIGGRRDIASAGNSEQRQTINALLAAMDGFASNEGILMIAATNRIEDLDSGRACG